MSVPLNQFDPNNPKRTPRFTTLRERMVKDNVGVFESKRRNKAERKTYYSERSRERLKPENITSSLFGRTAGVSVARARGASQEEIYRVAGITPPKKDEKQPTYRDNPIALKKIANNTAKTNELLNSLSVGIIEEQAQHKQHSHKKKSGITSKVLKTIIAGSILGLILENRKTRSMVFSMFSKVLMGLKIIQVFTKGFYNGFMKRDNDNKKKKSIFESFVTKTLLSMSIKAALPVIAPAAMGAAAAYVIGNALANKSESDKHIPRRPGEERRSINDNNRMKTNNPDKPLLPNSPLIPKTNDIQEAKITSSPTLSTPATPTLANSPLTETQQAWGKPTLERRDVDLDTKTYAPNNIVPAALIEKKTGTMPLDIDNIPPQGKALLDTIASTEGGSSYNKIVGHGGTFSDYSKHPNKVGLRYKDGRVSTAAGRYQFTNTEWNDLRKRHPEWKLNDFRPETQDRAAWLRAKELYKGDLGHDLLDPKKVKSIVKKLNNEWVSLPGGKQSMYDVDPLHPIRSARNLLREPFENKFADNLKQRQLNTGSILASASSEVDKGKGTTVVSAPTNNTVINNNTGQQSSNQPLPPVRGDDSSYRQSQKSIVKAGLF